MPLELASSGSSLSDELNDERPEELRSRIAAVLRAYAPKRLPQLDAMLAANAGQERVLLTTLVNRYGPEPEPGIQQQEQQQPPSADSGGNFSCETGDAFGFASTSGGDGALVTGDADGDASSEDERWCPRPSARTRVVALLRQHDPAKLASLDSLFGTGDPVVLANALARRISITHHSRSSNPLDEAATDEAVRSAFASLMLCRMPQLFESLAKNTADLPWLDDFVQRIRRFEMVTFSAYAERFAPLPSPADVHAAFARLLHRVERDGGDTMSTTEQASRKLKRVAGVEIQFIEAVSAAIRAKPKPPAPAATARRGGMQTTAPPRAPPKPVPPLPRNPRDRLAQLATEYEPEKSRAVDAFMARYRGRVDAELIPQLVERHVVRPPHIPEGTVLRTLHERVAAYLRHHLSDDHATINGFRSEEEMTAMLPTLIDRYGPDGFLPAYPGGDTHCERAVEILREHAPNELRELPSLMCRFHGHELLLVISLQARFSPRGAAAINLEEAGGDSGLVVDSSFRARLTAFFRHHALDAQLPHIDRMLRVYRDARSRKNLMESLVKRHGQEPPPAVALAAVFESDDRKDSDSNGGGSGERGGSGGRVAPAPATAAAAAAATTTAPTHRVPTARITTTRVAAVAMQLPPSTERSADIDFDDL